MSILLLCPFERNKSIFGFQFHFPCYNVMQEPASSNQYTKSSRYGQDKSLNLLFSIRSSHPLGLSVISLASFSGSGWYRCVIWKCVALRMLGACRCGIGLKSLFSSHFIHIVGIHFSFFLSSYFLLPPLQEGLFSINFINDFVCTVSRVV